MTLLGGVLLAAGILLYVLEPVFSGRRALLYGGEDQHDESAARRRVALAALRDLEYDRAAGKIDGDDYERLRAELSREALLRLGPEAVETDSPAAQASRALENEIATLRRALREGLQCGGCRRLNEFGAKYCGGCGERLGASRVAVGEEEPAEEEHEEAS